jgi:DNA-binding NtrC family response regulator
MAMLDDIDRNSISLVQMRFGIIGRSKQMMEVLQRLIQAAPTDLAVLITGETGTGKEIIANALHGLSLRKKYPFVSVNCGAIPETLLESELFGHEKGAFTGAVEQRKGFFEVAHRGTIFLDEIGEMPIGTQVKLLRVLESGEFSRLGSSALHKVDVRLIAATNRDLELDVRDGNFRQDLFFRLNSVRIKLPPLRNHTEDIPQLIDYFAEKVVGKLGIEFKGISDDAIEVLKSLHWKGNVRELRNLTETIITLEQGAYITPEILTHYLPAALPAFEHTVTPLDRAMIKSPSPDYTEQFELSLIFRTLLEMRHEISDLRQVLFRINDKIEALKANQTMMETFKDYHIEENEAGLGFQSLNIETAEKELIEAALEKCRGNRRQAAAELGISERSLYRKIAKYGLDE